MASGSCEIGGRGGGGCSSVSMLAKGCTLSDSSSLIFVVTWARCVRLGVRNPKP